MMTGEIKSKIDAVWNAFWAGGIANPLEVIEQITYLLFLRRLDDLHTLEENKAARLKQPMERRVFSKGKDGRGRSYEDFRWSKFKNFAPAEMYKVIGEHVFPFLRDLGGDGSLHHPHARAAGQGGGPARRRAHGGSRHQGRPLRVHVGQDRQRRAERPVPHAPPHHPPDG
jgi:type I restriction enzyme M protein